MLLSFETWGEGGGGRAPVLLLHSILEDRRTWRNIGPDIARATGRKVFAVDFRNHGLSPPSAEYGPWVLAADLEDFLEQQHFRQVALVGHSLGGVVAAMVAIRKPDLVEKLVLEETPPLGVDHSPSPLLLQAAEETIGALFDTLPPAADHGSALRSLTRTVAPLLPLFSLSPSLAETYDPLSLPLRWDGTALEPALNIQPIAQAAEEGAFRVNIKGRYEGEVLIINGACSKYTRTSDSFMSMHFPRGRCMSFEGAGHFVHHQFPIEFTREVVCFLNASPSKL